MVTIRDVAHMVAAMHARTQLDTVMEWPGLPDVVALETDHTYAGRCATELALARWRRTPGAWPAGSTLRDRHGQRPITPPLVIGLSPGYYVYKGGRTVVSVPVPLGGMLGFGNEQTMREHLADNPEATAALNELETGMGCERDN